MIRAIKRQISVMMSAGVMSSQVVVIHAKALSSEHRFQGRAYLVSLTPSAAIQSIHPSAELRG